MATTLNTGASVPADFSGGARIASVAAGVTMLWRAIGAPPLGPIVLGLGGLALIWHGLCRESSRGGEQKAAAERRRGGRARDRDAVQRASEDSFPASDPPSWTATNGPARRH